MTDIPVVRRRRVDTGKVVNLAGAAAAGVAVATLLFGPLANMSGPIGFAFVAYLAFLATYALLTSLTSDWLEVRDAIATVLFASAGLVALAGLFSVIFFTFLRGYRAMLHVNFYTQDMSKAGPNSPLTVGGMSHALVGTAWEMAIAVCISLPLGVSCAVYITESHSRAAGIVRTFIQGMTALPTILAGLFIYASWILTLGEEKSGLAASLALSIMMLPFVIRTSDLALRLVPNNLREAAAALGAPRWRVVTNVVLPTARPGLTTALVLAIARGIGEASPLLLTAGYTPYMNANPLHGPMVSLPLLAFTLVASGTRNFVSRGFGTAAFLLLVVLVLFITARILGGRGAGNLSPRQARRAARASERDVVRFTSSAIGDGRQPSEGVHP